MSADARPWDIDPALKPKRLLLLARLAVETRNVALAEANRELGDTNWGIGCKAHERFVYAVSKLAVTTEHGWLRVHRDGLSFVSMVEGVAIRAYRGDADKPHARHVYAAQLESDREPDVDPRQMALPFAFAAPEPAEKWAWLMAVETDLEGRAVRVVFFQANAAGSTRHAWIAPVESDDDARATADAKAEPKVEARVTRRPKQRELGSLVLA